MPPAVDEAPTEYLPLAPLPEAPNDFDALPRRYWTRVEYHAMGDAGVFGLWERVQLIEGEIIAVSPKSVPHTTATNRIFRRISRIFESRGCTVRKEDPIILDDATEPEPDVVVARGSETVYETRHPGPADLVLIVEVSGATLLADRAQKGRVYAHAGVPEYWLLNLRERLLEVYRESGIIGGEHGYRSVTLLGADETVAPLNAPDAAIVVRDLLP